MVIDIFSNKDVIKFCFLSNDEIDAKIFLLTTELVDLQRKVMNGHAYSEHENNKIITSIDILHECKNAKNKFVNELLNVNS